jgi:hypothetical protein
MNCVWQIQVYVSILEASSPGQNYMPIIVLRLQQNSSSYLGSSRPIFRYPSGNFILEITTMKFLMHRNGSIDCIIIEEFLLDALYIYRLQTSERKYELEVIARGIC